jgi:DNA replication and repair protein RecF
VEEMAPAARELYGELAETGKLDLAYGDSSESGERSGAELVGHFADAYRRSLPVDLERGRTTVGPHRDDVEILIDSREARSYASRGEQRSATLAFRLAELRLLPEAVLLLDDVLSELDPERRRRVFDVTGDRQTIITATEPGAVPGEAKVESVWHVSRGELSEGGVA